MQGPLLFLSQVLAILCFSHAVAWAFRKLGQPPVVGEMVAGIAMGPTLFGSVAPSAYAWLFPPSSLGPLSTLSEIGLMLFLLLVGVHVDLRQAVRASRATLFTSLGSITLPLVAGLALGYGLLPKYGHGNATAFVLFVATAISVTAFPVLARILGERKLLATPVGSVSLLSAAMVDLVGWILLAVITAMVSGATRPLPLTIAFAVGLMVPKSLGQLLIDKLEKLTLMLPMPIFFALTGIRTDLFPSSHGVAWSDFALILAVAVGSKWGGSMLGARAAGMSWRDAHAVGVLMNARGLVELVILNVGLQMGLIDPPLFSIMVLMALVTTLMTSPLLGKYGMTRT